MEPERMLQFLESDTAGSQDQPFWRAAADLLDEQQRAALQKARRWHESNPWELKKAKSRRAQRAAVRSMCLRVVEIDASQVLEQLLHSGAVVVRDGVLHLERSVETAKRARPSALLPSSTLTPTQSPGRTSSA